MGAAAVAQGVQPLPYWFSLSTIWAGVYVHTYSRASVRTIVCTMLHGIPQASMTLILRLHVHTFSFQYVHFQK